MLLVQIPKEKPHNTHDYFYFCFFACHTMLYKTLCKINGLGIKLVLKSLLQLKLTELIIYKGRSTREIRILIHFFFLLFLITVGTLFVKSGRSTIKKLILLSVRKNRTDTFWRS